MRKFLVLCLLAVSMTIYGQTQGMASYYGGKFHGRKTASGEIFDKNAMTCAHKTLPFGTMLKVTYLKNGKSVVVKVNDRGPFVRGRILDLAEGAAKLLGFDGIGLVAYEIVKPEIKKIEKKVVYEYRFLTNIDTMCIPWLPNARHSIICLGNYHLYTEEK